jgi:hypothetical protein
MEIKMKARRTELEISYNGKNVTTELADKSTSFSYTDEDSGSADSISLKIPDRNRQWISAWMPAKGDSIDVKLKVYDWTADGDTKELDCGNFVIDEISISGFPISLSINGVSSPADTEFNSTQRTQTWEKVTLKNIAEKICKRCGLNLIFDGTDITIKSQEQSSATDCSFLTSLCESYGLYLKIYSKKLVIFAREKYKAKDVAGKIPVENMESMSWKTDIAGTYTGGEAAYTNSKTGKDIKFSVGSGPRIYKMNEKLDSKSEAELKLNAAINKANHDMTTLSCKTIGNPVFVATQNVLVTGLGNLSGKYYINSVSHTAGSDGYTTSYELSLVESGTNAVYEDACDRLGNVGVSDTPGYWKLHYKEVKYLDQLILNLSARIKENHNGTWCVNVNDAIQLLYEQGVINTPEYWLKHYTDLTYLGKLMINAANALRSNEEYGSD